MSRDGGGREVEGKCEKEARTGTSKGYKERAREEPR